MEAGASRVPPLRPSWRTILAVFLALIVTAVALSQLQGLLAGMHVSGRPAASISGLNHLFHAGGDSKTASGALGVWKEYASSTVGQGTADAYEVAWWAVAIDFLLFAPLFAAVMALFFLRTRRQLDRWRLTLPSDEIATRLVQRNLVQGSEDEALGPGLDVYRKLTLLGLALVGVGLVADEVENVMNISIIAYGWRDANPDYDAGSFHALVWTLWISGWVKLLADLAAAGLVLILGWVVLARHDLRAGWTSVRRQLHVLRIQLLLVALIAIVPFAHEQIPDLIRRWSTAQLALTAALAWAFALTIWLIGRRLLVCGQWQPGWPPERRKEIGRILFWTLLILAAVQVVSDAVSSGSYRPGWGLAIPAVLLAGLAILGWLLPDAPPETTAADGGPVAPGSEHPALPRALAAFIVVAFGLGVLHASFGYSVYAEDWTFDWPPLVAVAAILGGTLVAALVGREPLIGGLLGAVAGLTYLEAVDGGMLSSPALVGAALLLIVGGWRVYEALAATAVPAATPALSWKVVLLLAVLLAAGYSAVIAAPFEVGERFGGIAILLFFIVVLACAGAVLVWVNPALHVPRALSVVQVKRFPILTLIVVWFVAASWLDHGGYHNVRLRDSDAPAAGVTLEAAWDCWLAKNNLPVNGKRGEECASSGSGPTRAGAVPLVMVATTGGGIRAAYWTDLVLDCAFEVAGRDCPTGGHLPGFARSDRLFALSGISGGSLGLASYAAYLSEKGTTGTESNWVERSLGGDALSGSVGWWLFAEIPRAFLQFRSPTDRAAVLERGWERQWPHGELGQGLLQVWRSDHHQPLLLLNGTSVADGCRFETSPLDANVETRAGTAPGCKSTDPFDDRPADVSSSSVLPATKDLVDFLCNDRKDVRLSTAALLSARFPFVNPSARVASRCDFEASKPPVAYVVDGGYLDTSGASPIVELMNDLQPLVDRWNAQPGHAGRCIVPVMLQIDNGFAAGASSPPRRPGELLVPPKTVLATRGAREAEARVGGALLFSESKGASDRYAHFVNEAHAGPKAPLGWTQSRVSEHELVSQLTQARNSRAFHEVRSWLRPGGLRCPGPR